MKVLGSELKAVQQELTSQQNRFEWQARDQVCVCVCTRELVCPFVHTWVRASSRMSRLALCTYQSEQLSELRSTLLSSQKRITELKGDVKAKVVVISDMVRETWCRA